MDARLPVRWHGSLQMDDLSDAAWRVLTGALMWSNQSGTDGAIPSRYRIRMHPSGDMVTVAAAEAELEAAQLIERRLDGYQLIGWGEPGILGQTTSDQMQTYRANSAKRSAEYRARRAERLAAAGPAASTEQGESRRASRRDVHGDATHDVGKGEGLGEGSTDSASNSEPKDGLDSEGRAQARHPDSWEAFDRSRSEVAPGSSGAPDVEWPVAAIPKSSDKPSCRVCGGPLVNGESMRRGVCSIPDQQHRRAWKAAS